MGIHLTSLIFGMCLKFVFYLTTESIYTVAQALNLIGRYLLLDQGFILNIFALIRDHNI